MLPVLKVGMASFAENWKTKTRIEKTSPEAETPMLFEMTLKRMMITIPGVRGGLTHDVPEGRVGHDDFVHAVLALLVAEVLGVVLLVAKLVRRAPVVFALAQGAKQQHSEQEFESRAPGAFAEVGSV